MKECKKCSKQYDDSFVFCPDCGERLSPSAPKISKRNALLIVCIAAALLIIGGSVHELSQVKSQKDAIEQSKYDRALQEYLSADINRGDLTPFIIGTLQFIEQATLFTHHTLKHKYQTYQKAKEKLTQTPSLSTKNKTTAAICDILLQAAIFSDIGVSVKEIIETLNISENTVYNHLKKISEEYLWINKEIRPYRYQLRL